MISIGIDAGSRAIKIVLLDMDTQEILATGIADQAVRQEQQALDLLNRLMEENHLGPADIGRTIATGYGRNGIRAADSTVTEITCHAVGVHHLLPQTKTVIDIGGQDSKVISLHTNGTVRDFVMNDRCAAGTGCFLEVVARRLGVELQQMGHLAGKSQAPAIISSMCVVFAETEIIGLLAEGTAPPDIIAGVQNSICSRLVSMTGRNTCPPVVFTGGVALVPGMETALARVLGQTITTAPQPQMTGALGAALLAARQGQEQRKENKS